MKYLLFAVFSILARGNISIVSVAPASGTTAGGTRVTINGGGFTPQVTVKFADRSATNLTFISAAKLIVSAPPGAPGVVGIVVTGASGACAVAPNAYTYGTSFAISRISPPRGTVTGGTSVTITGTGFGAGSKVTFGGAAAIPTQIVSSTEIRTVAPAASAPAGGPVSVVVKRAAGGSASGSFDYVGPQAVTSVSPAAGPASGGTMVTIRGSGFAPATEILFGTNPASKATLVDSLHIAATLPPGTGVVNVSAFTAGFGTASLSNAFTYLPGLSVTEVSPSIGPAGGGNQLFVTGTGFLPGATIFMGSGPAQRANFQNSTTLSITPGAHPPGAVTVIVTNPQGARASLSGAYTFTTGPSVWNVSPSSGPLSGGSIVTLSGANLRNVSQVTFGVQPATILSAKESGIIVSAPPGAAAAAVDITVNSPSGKQVLSRAFNYLKLAIATEGIDDGYPAIPYKIAFTTNGAGVPPYAWSLSSGNLPPGLTLAPATGILAGTPMGPPNAAPYSFTISVQDSASPRNRTQKPFQTNILYGFNPGIIPPEYFGMTLNDPADWPLPSPQGAGLRIGSLGKGLAVSWPFIEQVKGVYNWTRLDQYVQQAQSHGVDIFYTNFNFPPWAVPNSSNPSNCGAYANTNPPIVACSNMVANLQDWKDWSTALVTRYKGKIRMYELFNEPNSVGSFTGTVAQMVDLSNALHDVIRAIDPLALIGTPSASANYFSQYLKAGGTSALDLINIHGYPNVSVNDLPEFILTRVAGTKQVAIGSGSLARLPLWDTETGWGNNAFALSDPQQRAAFVARYLLLQWSAGIARAYWYAWDEPNWGTLFEETSAGVGQNYPAAFAYRQVQSWMLGASMTVPCTANGGAQYTAVYSCDLYRSGGYQARAVWNAGLRCVNNFCPALPYSPDSRYLQYRDSTGTISPISPGQTVPVGPRPILLENQITP